MSATLLCAWPGKLRRVPQGRTIITVIVVLALITVSAASLSWQDLLAALIIEVAAGWLLAALPLPLPLRRPARM